MLQKYAAIITSLILMFVFLSFIFADDLKIPQREVTMSISIKNQVNICLPNEDFDEKNL